MQTEELLTELRMSQTDLARFVEAVVRDSMPYVVVPVEAVRPGIASSASRPKSRSRWRIC